MEFNVLENKILKQLEDLKKVFKIISKKELLLHYDKVNYEITLRSEKIKSSLLIPTRLERQEIIREYLDEIIKKE